MADDLREAVARLLARITALEADLAAAKQRIGEEEFAKWNAEARNQNLEADLRIAKEDLAAAREELRDVRDWLKSPQMGLWRYMENGDFYTDKTAKIESIDAALGGE